MADLPPHRLLRGWRRLNLLDRVAIVMAVILGALVFHRWGGRSLPGAGLFIFLLFLAAGYLAYRLLGWARTRLLWSLRNRLVVAYVFIAVVPVLLLLTMVALAANILYSQLGGFLLYEELEDRVRQVATAADLVSRTAGGEGESAEAPSAWRGGIAAHLAALEKDLPGITFETHTDREFVERFLPGTTERFSGIVQEGDRLAMMAVVGRRSPGGKDAISARVPLTSEFLETLAPYLGPIQLVLTRPVDPSNARGAVRIGNRLIRVASRIATHRRTLQPPQGWLDSKIEGLAKTEAVSLEPGSDARVTRPVFAFFSARPTQLNQRLFSSPGELGGIYFQFLVAIGIIFLILEVGALITGIVLTRTITHTVADLYRATQYVRTGDFSQRVRIERNDQLGVLGESFNSMTGSISTLIEEQRQRQRLENELSIAREVQAQLFPRSLPQVQGIHIEAICRAARMVSGDYYDIVPLGPSRLGIVIADIAGKGISAALLMASLQAALRSQLLLDGQGTQSTAELVARLNRHLYLNTSEDRYATLFYAVYDAATRTLRYTNAGHLPPLYIAGGRVQKLEEGGTVVGLFDQCPYEQGVLHIDRGSLLLAYSDGLIEPENVYGEEFGVRRLVEVALANQSAGPQVLAERLMVAAEEWGGTSEQADDMTVIVARIE